MRKFLQGVMEWKMGASLMFTGSIILYTFISLFFGNKTLEISAIISLLIISAIGTFLQFLAFSDYIIKNIRYTLRLIIFIVPFAALLTVCAVLFRWFPIEFAGSWIVFILIFIMAFIGITIGFEIYFRLTGKKYDGLLGQYKKKSEGGQETGVK